MRTYKWSFVVRCVFVISFCLFADPAWSTELPVVPGGKLGPFQHGTYPSLGDRTHAGVDILAPCGAPVYPLAEGTVVDSVIGPSDPHFESLGYMAIVEHPRTVIGREFYTLYLHLEGPPAVLHGPIQKNQQLGKVGNTGRTDGTCHVHFEVRYFKDRFSPVWRNIYGSGDQRDSIYFQSAWEDPLSFIARLSGGQQELAQQPASPVHGSVEITSIDGTILRGTISGGFIAMKTALGELKIDARRIRAVAGSSVSLDDGSVLQGTMVGGEVQVSTVHGTFTIPAQKIKAIADTQRASSLQEQPGSSPTFPGQTARRSTAVGPAQVVGRVLDNFGQPIPNANVWIEKTDIKTVTDVTGQYSIRYVPGQFTLHFSKDGYFAASLSFNATGEAVIPAEPVELVKQVHDKGIFAFGVPYYSEYVRLNTGWVKYQYKEDPRPEFRAFPPRLDIFFVPGYYRFPELILPSGKNRQKVRFLDTDPDDRTLVRLTQRNGISHVIMTRNVALGLVTKVDVVEIDKEATEIAKGVWLHEAELEEGFYAFVPFKEGVMILNPSDFPIRRNLPVYLFSVR